LTWVRAGGTEAADFEAGVGFFAMIKNEPLNNPKLCRPHAGIVFGAVEKSLVPIGFLPGACALPEAMPG
jgi:hypothetical protein